MRVLHCFASIFKIQNWILNDPENTFLMSNFFTYKPSSDLNDGLIIEAGGFRLSKPPKRGNIWLFDEQAKRKKNPKSQSNIALIESNSSRQLGKYLYLFIKQNRAGFQRNKTFSIRGNRETSEMTKIYINLLNSF